MITKGVAKPLPGQVVEEEIGGGVEGGREVAKADEDVGHRARHRLGYWGNIFKSKFASQLKKGNLAVLQRLARERLEEVGYDLNMKAVC